MKRHPKILWAYIRLEWYLLTAGMWRGECAFTAGSDGDGTVLIAASTGSIWDDSIKITRIFWDEKNLAHNLQ